MWASFKTEALSHLESFTSRRPHTAMQGAKTSSFSVESLISKESFAEPRMDGTHACISLPRCPSTGQEITRTSPSFSTTISIPRPLTLEGVGSGHASAFSQTSQLPLSNGRAFAIQRNTEHHAGTKFCYCAVLLFLVNVYLFQNSNRGLTCALMNASKSCFT